MQQHTYGNRIYEVRNADRSLLCWGASRNGSDDDREMEAAVAARHVCGTTRFHVTFMAQPKRQQRAEAVLSGRVRRMEQRARRKCPLYAADLIAQRLREPDFDLGVVQQHQERRAALERQWQREWWEEHSEEKRVQVQEEKLEGVQ